MCVSVWIERGLRMEMTSLEPPGGGGHANHGFNEEDGVRNLIANHKHKFRRVDSTKLFAKLSK